VECRVERVCERKSVAGVEGVERSDGREFRKN
jgi:hypothetical protein